MSQRLNILGIAWFSYTRLYDFETKPDRVQAMDIQAGTTCIIIQVDILTYDQDSPCQHSSSMPIRCSF